MALQPRSNPELELMARVSSMYYLQDLTQEEIAKSLGLSRPKVGRLLKRARAERIVEITVHLPPELSMSAEAELAARFSMQQVVLVGDHKDEATRRLVVAHSAGSYLARVVQNGTVVAVGMGRNIGAIADEMTNPPRRSCSFISGIGGSSQIDAQVNSNEIARRLAAVFGGQHEGIYAPAYAENEAVRQAFMSHDDVRQTLERAKRADIALVGIGDAKDDSAVVRMGCVSAREMRRMREQGAVGDILGAFFDINGDPVPEAVDGRVVGLSRDDLRKIRSVVAIVSERSKSPALLGALRSGIVDVLVTSVETARQVLALDVRHPRTAVS